MAYTIRNLIADAFDESGVVTEGMTVQAYEESKALSTLNLILDEIYGRNAGTPMGALTVDFTGESDYTIGVADPISTEPQPDIVTDINPQIIERIILDANGSRLVAYPIDPISYHSRANNTLNDSLPIAFYYEKQNPWGVIKFYEGMPSGAAEIIMQGSLVDVTASTDYKYFPRALKPYLVYELAARIAMKNAFDATQLQVRANLNWGVYKSSIYSGQQSNIDHSLDFDNHDGYDIISDRGW